MKKSKVTASRDSGFHSLECEVGSPPTNGQARLTIFMLGKRNQQNIQVDIFPLPPPTNCLKLNLGKNFNLMTRSPSFNSI